jgi:hypothetical protein
MEIRIHQIMELSIAEIRAEGIIISDTQDALDLMADCNYKGSWKMIIYEKNIIPNFFNLKSGLAGEILQKFSTYGVQLAIIGDFSKYPGRSLNDFIFESNKYGRINFVTDFDEAVARLTQ